MARTTRSGKTAKGSAKSEAPATSSTSKYALPEESKSSPKLFVLPTDVTPEARIVSLPNPRYSKPTRYLVCPKTGIHEFTKISAPKTTPRSWLITQEDGTAVPQQADDEAAGDQSKSTDTESHAYVTRSAEFFIATKVDPVFLLLPSLMATSSKSDTKRMFLSSDDHLDKLAQQGDSHLSETLRWGGTRELLEARMASVCDTVEAGDESMYRLNESKLLELLLAKAKRVSLPKSMAEKFVTRALEAPVLSRKSTAPGAASAPKTEGEEAEAGSQSGATTDTGDSQSSVATTDTSTSAVSDASTAATSVAADEDAAGGANGEVNTAIQASEEVVRLQRLRIAFNFICSNYLPPALTATLKKTLQDSPEGATTTSFAPLDEYLARLTKVRQEATLARSASDFSRKRMLDDEEEEERAEKRRKKEEEDKKKKAGVSRGVKELKKVNVTGMKKLSEFFKKK